MPLVYLNAGRPDLERTVAVTGIDPDAVRCNAIWPGDIVVHSDRS
jgi:hypothetical protein